jgi:predicted porin
VLTASHFIASRITVRFHLLGIHAAQAQAQSSVVIYGTVDAGVSKATGSTAEVGSRANNRIGFKGAEDLGNGLKAIFQLEMRFASDTGITEGAGTRPLFQGQSTVGVQSAAFGTVRLGRALTATQESLLAFEPWNGIASKAGFNNTGMQLAGYSSDPYRLGTSDVTGDKDQSSKNRFANAVFYNSPVFSGFQANATVGSREAQNTIGHNASSTTAIDTPAFAAADAKVPYSLSGTYNNAMFAAMAAYERNAVDEKFWSVAGSVVPMANLKLMANYSHQDQGSTIAGGNDKTKAWLVGANYTMGPGKFLAGYGQKDPDFALKTKQVSLGYEYSLSKRTYVYADISNKKAPAVATSTNDTSVTFYGAGVNHSF